MPESRKTTISTNNKKSINSHTFRPNYYSLYTTSSYLGSGAAWKTLPPSKPPHESSRWFLRIKKELKACTGHDISEYWETCNFCTCERVMKENNIITIQITTLLCNKTILLGRQMLWKGKNMKRKNNKGKSYIYR